MKRKISTALALAALLTLSITTSANAGSSAATEGGDERPVLGKAQFTGEMSNADRGDAKATVEINSLKRAKGSELTTLVYTVHNEHDTEPFPLTAWSKNLAYYYTPLNSLGGAVLDIDDKIRYHNLTDEKFYCFCSNTNGESTADVLFPGSSGVIWGSFLVPKDVKSVTVRVPAFGPVKDIPIS